MYFPQGWPVSYTHLDVYKRQINNLIPGRRYPLLHSHHPHHAEFTRIDHTPYAALKEQDFKWALGQIDGFIDVSAEDLVDLYEFAVEHAQSRK